MNLFFFFSFLRKKNNNPINRHKIKKKSRWCNLVVDQEWTLLLSNIFTNYQQKLDKIHSTHKFVLNHNGVQLYSQENKTTENGMASCHWWRKVHSFVNMFAIYQLLAKKRKISRAKTIIENTCLKNEVPKRTHIQRNPSSYSFFPIPWDML